MAKIDSEASKITYSTYPEVLTRFRSRRDEMPFIISKFTRIAEKYEALKGVKSILCLGPGIGEYDLEFMTRCLPSLEQCIFVELDPTNIATLEKNVKERYGDRLKFEVHLEDMSKYNYDGQFDMVLANHCLSAIPEECCTKMLHKCFDKWLRPGEGLLLVLNVDKLLGNQGENLNGMQCIHHKFKDRVNQLTLMDYIYGEIVRLGGDVLFDEAYVCDWDAKFDEDFTAFLNMKSRIPIESDVMRTTIESLFPEGTFLFPARLILVRNSKTCFNHS